MQSLKSKPQSLLSKLWRESQTKVLAYSQATIGGVLLTASQLNGLVTDGSFSSALNQLNLPPWFPYVLVGLALLTYLAHGHEDV